MLLIFFFRGAMFLSDQIEAHAPHCRTAPAIKTPQNGKRCEVGGKRRGAGADGVRLTCNRCCADNYESWAEMESETLRVSA